MDSSIQDNVYCKNNKKAINNAHVAVLVWIQIFSLVENIFQACLKSLLNKLFYFPLFQIHIIIKEINEQRNIKIKQVSHKKQI